MGAGSSPAIPVGLRWVADSAACAEPHGVIVPREHSEICARMPGRGRPIQDCQVVARRHHRLVAVAREEVSSALVRRVARNRIELLRKFVQQREEQEGRRTGLGFRADQLQEETLLREPDARVGHGGQVTLLHDIFLQVDHDGHTDDLHGGSGELDGEQYFAASGVHEGGTVRTRPEGLLQIVRGRAVLEGKGHRRELALVVLDVLPGDELAALVVIEELARGLLEDLKPHASKLLGRKLSNIFKNVGVRWGHVVFSMYSMHFFSIVAAVSTQSLAVIRNILTETRINQNQITETRPMPFIDTREFVRIAVANDGLALEHASEALCGDREIVIAAVEEDGNALEFT